MSTAGKLLSGVGTLPAVPKKITRMLMLYTLHFFEHGYLSRQGSVDVSEMGLQMLIAQFRAYPRDI
jgi:hypothetical protein